MNEKNKKIVEEFDLHRYEDVFDYNHLPFYSELDECLSILRPKHGVNVQESNKLLNFVICMCM